MEKFVELSLLLDFYSPLLSKRQADLLRIYCEEDMTISEIADNEAISRQAVFDAIHKGEQQLRHFEEQLGMLKKFMETQAIAKESYDILLRVCPTEGTIDEYKALLVSIKKLMKLEYEARIEGV